MPSRGGFWQTEYKPEGKMKVAFPNDGSFAFEFVRLLYSNAFEVVLFKASIALLSILTRMLK